MNQEREDVKVEFAENVKREMKLQDLKVPDMVRLSQETGKAIHRDTLYKILRAKTSVSLYLAKKIAKCLKVRVSVLADDQAREIWEELNDLRERKDTIILALTKQSQELQHEVLSLKAQLRKRDE